MASGPCAWRTWKRAAATSTSPSLSYSERPPKAHRAAAGLLTELVDAAERPAAHPHVAPRPPRKPRSPSRRKLSATPALLGLRVFIFAVLASTAFMLTTWPSTLR
jgi:anti-sigma factor RsiW